MAGLGELLDASACGISGHIWIVNSGTDGVMVCSRCHREEQAPPAPAVEGPVDAPNSLLPPSRPWLEAPFTVSDLE
jgi:hypothetical protein